MRQKKRITALLVAGIMLFTNVPVNALAVGSPGTGGLCEHHTEHSFEICGYTEGAPCSHEHSEDDCYTLEENCVHEHTDECYPAEDGDGVSGDTATSSNADKTAPTECTHVCSEDEGCITKTLDCRHEHEVNGGEADREGGLGHDNTCGYIEAAPCTFVCEECKVQDSGDQEPPQRPECVCTGQCTEESVNGDCPVCGGEGVDLALCEGEQAAVCICTDLCAEGSVNGDCPICGAEGADLTQCQGEADAITVEKVQEMIDALPTVDELANMDADEQQEVYTALQTAYDAYDALTGEQKAQITGAEIFESLFGFFNGMVNALAADPVSYISYHWDSAKEERVQDQTTPIENYTTVTETTTTWDGAITEGWYVVRGTVTIGDRVEVKGDVHLILMDNASLTCNGGIHVADDDNNPETESPNRLTIYAQSNDSSMGSLTANGGNYNAGIGGTFNKDMDGGTITIHGGNVTATSGSAGAGIGGGGDRGSGGTITIFDGKVTANGGGSSGYGGAGIGGSHNSAGGDITIHGGTVNATGGYHAAGIGGGYGGSNGSVTITDGNVTATSGGCGAGIGGGGGGGSGGTITISGGKVTATGGNDSAGSASAGIGGGDRGSGGTITISGGAVKAVGGGQAFDIGGGRDRNGNHAPSDKIEIDKTHATVTGSGTNGEVEINDHVANTWYKDDANNHWKLCKHMGCTNHRFNEGQHNWGTENYAETNGAWQLSRTCGTCGREENLSLTSISIQTSPTKMGYDQGDTLDLNGLKIKATYSEGSVTVEKEVSFSANNGMTFSINGVGVAYNQTLTGDHNGHPITVTYHGKNDTTTATLKVKLTQTMSFEEQAVTKNYKDANFTNTLTQTDVHGTITYTSSDENVATVDGNGEVTIVKASIAPITITATATETDTYAETAVSYTLTVNQLSIADTTVTLSPAEFYYDGSEKKPTSITVTKDGKTLVKDVDYTVTYSQNGQLATDFINAGTITVAIEGIDNCTGTKTPTYEIKQSGTEFDGGIKLDKAYDAYTYGDTVTVEVMPKATGNAPANAKMRLTPIAENQMAIFEGDTQLTEPQTFIDEALTFEIEKLNAGTHNLTARYVGNGNMAGTVQDFTVTVNQKPLTLESAVLEAKIYDGETDGTVTGATLNGTVYNEALEFGTDYTASAKYDTADAGESRTATVTVELKNTVTAKNYSSPQNTLRFENLTISKAAGPAAPTVSGSYAVDPDDVGKFAHTVEITSSTAGAVYEYQMDGTAAGQWQESNVFKAIQPASTHTFYARIKETNNVNVGEVGDTGAVTFNRLNRTDVPALAVTVTGNMGNRTVTIAEVAGAEYQFGDDSWGDSNTKTGVTGTITAAIRYKATDTLNASDEVTQQVNTDKEEQAALEIAAVGAKTYGDAAFELKTTGGSGNGNVTFTSSDSSILEISGNVAAIKKAGQVTITATKAEDVTYASATATLTLDVQKKDLTIKADDKRILIGAAKPEYTATATGLVNGETISGVNFTDTAADTSRKGNYIIIPEGGTISGGGNENYEITYQDGTLTINVEIQAIDNAIAAANAAKEGVKVDDREASRVTKGTKFVTTAEMDALNTAMETAAAAKGTVSTAEEMQAAVKALEDAVASFQTAVKTGTHTSSSGDGDGGSSDSGNDGSTNAAGADSGRLDTPTPSEIQPTKPDNGGHATVNNDAIKSAIEKAKEDAKKNSNIPNGVAVAVPITPAAGQASFDITIQAQTLNALAREKVQQFELRIEGILAVSFNEEALKWLEAAANGGDLHVRAVKVETETFSQETRAAIGTRPVYDVTLVSVSGGKETPITDLGGHTASVRMAYTPAAGESIGSLYAVHVDGNGKAEWLTKSSYNPNRKAVLFETTHFRIFGVGRKTPVPAFTDLADHWAKADIEFAVSRGLLSGTENGQFSPNTGMSRGMFVTALGRLAGIDPAQYQARSFTDVKADAYYAPYVTWAAQNGIVNGTTAVAFAPDATITREQMAVIVKNYAQKMGYVLPKTLEAVTFADNAQISFGAKEAVRTVQQAGIMVGKDENRFDPQGMATRAEAAAVLRRFVEIAIDPQTVNGWTTNDSGTRNYRKDSKPAAGWLKDDEKWYWLENGGKPFAGDWKLIDGKWYYFYADGTMAADTTIDGYTVGKDGACQ